MKYVVVDNRQVPISELSEQELEKYDLENSIILSNPDGEDEYVSPKLLEHLVSLVGPDVVFEVIIAKVQEEPVDTENKAFIKLN